jgi:hypothetical protein
MQKSLLCAQVVRDTSVRGKWRAPANLHIGNMGVAPAIAIPANSIPPTASIGGNVDNRRSVAPLLECTAILCTENMEHPDRQAAV